jgi:Zinc finger, C2H2 type
MLSNSNLSLENHQAHLHQHQQPLLEPQPISTIINSTQQQSTTMQSQVISSISNLTDQQYPLVINTNIPSYHITITEEQNYHNTIGNLRHTMPADITSMQSPSDDETHEQFTLLPSLHPHPGQYMTSYDQLLSRYTGGVAYNGDLPPFSPDIPEQYHSTAMTGTSTTSTTSPYEEEMVPQSAVAPSSPSISTTHIQSTLSMTTLSSATSSSSSSLSNISTTTANVPKASNKNSATSTTAPNEYRCDICDKVFNKSCYLTQHNKTFHCGEKPFKCQRCGKRFPCDASHEEHVAKHAGDKPFKCVQCPKSFNHKTDLRRHMCLHSGSKPYTCSQCGKGFIRKDHMVKHTETHTKRKSNGNKKLKGNKKRLSSISILPDSSDSMQFIVSE